MSPQPRQLPSCEEARSLHRRLCERHPSAPAHLSEAYIGHLVAWLAERYPRVDEHLRLSAIHDTLIDLCVRPHSYDPEQLGLAAFLRMSARRDLLNQFRGEARHHEWRRAWNVVEPGDADGNYLGKEDDPSLPLIVEEERQAASAAARSDTATWTDAERRVAELMRQGERRSSAFAAVLGVTHLSEQEQRREVKRVKDRIKKRREREGGTHD